MAHFQATLMLEDDNPFSECERTLWSSVQGERLNSQFYPKTENSLLTVKTND